MKKTIASMMLAATALGGLMAPSISAFASEVNNNDGTQTITGQQDSQVEFKGLIGEIDPGTTDPEDPDVPGPGTEWIKVKLPTKVVYYSTADSKHEQIKSGSYDINNLSAYPVDVQVTGFVGADGTSAPNIDKILDLKMMSGNKAIDLVKQEKVSTPNDSIFKLGASSKATNPQDNTDFEETNQFNIVGSTVTSSDFTKQTTLDNKLDITLVGLDADGKVPTESE